VVGAVVGSGLAGLKHWIVGPLLAVGSVAAWMYLTHRWIWDAQRRAGVVPGDNVDVLYPASQKRAARGFVGIFVWSQTILLVVLVTFVIYALATK
jgi:hypothetical protein